MPYVIFTIKCNICTHQKSYHKKRSCIPRCFYIESLKRLCIFIGKVLEPLLDIGIYVKYYRFLNISRKILPD